MNMFLAGSVISSITSDLSNSFTCTVRTMSLDDVTLGIDKLIIPSMMPELSKVEADCTGMGRGVNLLRLPSPRTQAVLLMKAWV